MSRVKWVRFDPFALTADRWWRRVAPAERGIYWSLVTDLYTADGRLLWDAAEIAAVCNCFIDNRPDTAKIEAVVAAAGFKREIDTDGREWLTHPKITKELLRSKDIYQLRVEGGKRGGRPRKELDNESPNEEDTGGNLDQNLKISGEKTLRLQEKNLKVLEEKPSPFFLKSREREEMRREEIDRKRDRKRDENAKSQGIKGSPQKWGNGTGRFFRFVQAVQGELNVASKADISTIRHVAEYLLKKEQDGSIDDKESLLLMAWERARDVKGADKPIAVWVNIIKDEFGWQPKSTEKNK